MSVCASLLMSDVAYAEKDAFARQASFEKQTQDSQSGNCSLNWCPTCWEKWCLHFEAIQVQWTQIISMSILFHCYCILLRINLCINLYIVLLDQKHTLEIIYSLWTSLTGFSCPVTRIFSAFPSCSILFQFPLPLLLHWAWPSWSCWLCLVTASWRRRRRSSSSSQGASTFLVHTYFLWRTQRNSSTIAPPNPSDWWLADDKGKMYNVTFTNPKIWELLYIYTTLTRFFW